MAPVTAFAMLDRRRAVQQRGIFAELGNVWPEQERLQSPSSVGGLFWSSAVRPEGAGGEDGAKNGTEWREKLLWWLHLACLAIHSTWLGLTLTASSGDMTVEITRIKPSWKNQGGEYSYEVVPLDTQIFRIDIVTAIFFGQSAVMHGMWVLFGRSALWRPVLWDQLTECRCWWCAPPAACRPPRSASQILSRLRSGVGWSTRAARRPC